MESRLLILLLAQACLLACLSGCARQRLARADDEASPPVVEPDVERRDVKPADIDTEDFEIGVFAGQMSVEDFGVNTVLGARFAYHITEGLFTELTAGRTNTGQTSFERLSGAAQLLTDPEREYTYYNLSLGYNLLPGEGFLGKNRSWNTDVYVIGGVGKTTFAGDDRFTVNVGMGLRLMPLDWLAVHADVRDHIFDIDLLGRAKRSNNLEAHVGVTFFF
jgi:outer membrane beta-barrel protein